VQRPTKRSRLSESFRRRVGVACASALFAASLTCTPARAQEAHWRELNAQIAQLQKQGKTEEALPIAQEAARVAESTFGADNANTATAVLKLGTIYSALGSYPEAEPLLKRAMGLQEKLTGADSCAVAEVANALGQAYDAEGKFDDAEPLLKDALAIREKLLGANSALAAESVNTLGELYYYQGKRTQAGPLFERAYKIREKVLGPEDPRVAESLGDLGVVYDEEGRYAEAEPLDVRALAIREKALGPEHPDVAESLNNLANLYDDESRYAQAEPLHKRALAIHEKVFGAEHPNVAMDLSNLALLYQAQGRYGEEEPLEKRALAIYEKLFGPEHSNVAAVLNNMAQLYQLQGRNREAEPLMKRAVAINEKALGPEHPDVATALSGLAMLYVNEGRYAEAEPLYKRVLAIREKVLGPEHPDVAGVQNNLAFLYQKQNRNSEAEPLYARALAIEEKVLGPNHPDVAAAERNLAELYAAEGRNAEAEPLYKRSLTIDEAALGADHPRVATGALYCLAKLYFAEGQYDKAEPLVERSLTILRERFEYSFAYMSEKDRLQFLGTVKDVFTLYFNFSRVPLEQKTQLSAGMYNLLLWQKGMVSASVATLRAQVAAGGDKQAIKLFEELTAKKAQSSRLVATRPDGWQEARQRADTEANELEQQLARHVSTLAEQKTLASATWQDVRKTLKPGDAAVEFVRFPYFDGKNKAGKTYYIALVIRPENASPELVQLGDAQAIEGAAFSEYRAEVGIRKQIALAVAAGSGVSPWRSLYDAVWKPLETPLAGAQRVYVSLDGALNEMPLAVLQAADGRRVMETYDFRVVSSTRDLLRTRHHSSSNTAILVGNPRFLLSDAEQLSALNRVRGAAKPEPELLLASAALPANSASLANPANLPNPASGVLSRDAAERGACNPPPPAGGLLCPLPGTATEVQSISELLREKNWSVATYQDEQALEEVVKNAASPRVLHLATHGFFLSDQQVKLEETLSGKSSGLEDPMMRSGLFFAGADRTLKNEAPIQGVETGVLTAYEATALNLQGTELVVLSACETGRGQVQNGEGVFGLGRALQEAGAEAVVMSLWSVPDRETQELMTQLYKNWLAGMDKPEALRRAQLAERDRVKERYGEDRPYYWGAFTLVGQ
jgi:CHAT domain-containing protein/tetratricopeptide (TPR) repeat protein